MDRRVPSRRMTDSQRRAKYRARKAAIFAATLCAVIALALLDRLGLFGVNRSGDWDIYHDRTFTVARVIDGDTIVLDMPDGESRRTTVRLWGVDTPETVKPNHPVEHFGREASRFTASTLKGHKVRIELEQSSTRDKYNRLLAFVYLPDGGMLNRMLIAQGFGYADPRFKHAFSREFDQLQKKARASGIGLWKDVTDEELPHYLTGKTKEKK